MLKPYINHFIDSLCKSSSCFTLDKPLILDIVFEGGLFNGSYLAGGLFYLKELENRKIICIQRLSGCSIGAITALLYFIDNEEIILKIYQLASQHFKEKYNLNMFPILFDLLRTNLPDNIMERINGKLYISYYNVKTREQVVKKTYKNIDDLFETIRRSCSFPYVIDKKLFYKKVYIDGLYPYLFNNENDTNNNSKNKKILYFNIHQFNKLGGMLSIKNEPTNIYRILEGILEIHILFLTGKKTNICSFANDWTLIDHLYYYFFTFFMNLFFVLLHYIYIVRNMIQHSQEKENGHIDFYKLMHNMYIYLLKKYCI